jgi:hypothetical protein
MFNNSSEYLDITGHSIRLISIERKIIRRWCDASIPEGMVKDGLILKPEVIGTSIDALFESMKLPRNNVTCTVTGLPFIYRTISLPHLANRNLVNEAIERAADKEMPLSKHELYLSYNVLKSREEEVMNVSRQPLFGTNGIRGISNLDLSPQVVLRASQAVGVFFNGGLVLVGRDGRTSGKMFSLGRVSRI